MPQSLTNPRHEAFAQGLALGLTVDAAYVEAGFKPNRGNAARLKANESVRARVAFMVDAGARRAEIDIARVIEELTRIAFTGMSKFLRINRDGDPVIDLSNCTPADLDLLTEATVEDFREGRGKNSRMVRRIKIRPLDRLKALEKLANYLTMGDKANGGTMDSLAQALQEISQRGSVAPIATISDATRRE